VRQLPACLVAAVGDDAVSELYIYVVDWRRFQHYRDRQPLWLKDYVEQLDDEEYLTLSLARRGLLKDVRSLYARSREHLAADVRALSRRLGARVTWRDLEALSHAGFIEVLASDELAERLQADSELLAVQARARARSREREGETVLRPSLTPTVDHEPEPPPTPLEAASAARSPESENSQPPGRPRKVRCPYLFETGPCGIEVDEDRLPEHLRLSHGVGKEP
jgi:hypothetical protein